MDRGVFPWWTLEEVKLAFFRPVAVVTHRLDHALWPDWPVLLHAQSLFWLGAMVAAAAIAYRRVLGVTAAAGLAGLAYAVDDAHGFPAAWVANRNALLGATFGLLALAAHDRWRRSGWRAGAVVGPVLLAMGLCSAEAAVGTLALLVAHALFLDQGGLGQRAAAVAPHLAVVVVWRVTHDALGYGAYGSAYYLDPLVVPLPFVAAVAERAPVLLLGQWAIAPIDFYVFLPEGVRMGLWIAALAFLPLVAWLLRELLRRDAAARFFTAAMLLAVVPACATFPMERVLLFVGFGAMGLLGQLLSALPEKPAARTLAIGLAAVHLVAAPLLLPVRALSPFIFAFIERNIQSVPDDPRIAEKDLVVVNAPDPYSSGFVPVLRALQRRPFPAHVRRLASSNVPVTVRRADERTLSVRPDGGYLVEPDAALVRDARHPMHRGDRVELTGVTVEITDETADGRPAEATFRFDRRLDDPSFLWLAMGEHGFVPWSPPAVGRTIRLPVSPRF